MSARKREYSGLDSFFNKLQVTPPEERKTENAVTPNNDQVVDPSVEAEIGRRVNAQRKCKRRKCVIRKAKLILPKPLSGKKKDDTDNTEDSETEDNNNHQVAEENTNPSGGSGAETPVTCGAQYLQQEQGTSLQQTPEDSSPDELAAYFEQILYIPKPMSLMAQMMYA